jgi:hypothetical protein
MELAPKHVREVFLENNIQFIYHANTVLSSCHFIRRKALISRGTMERLGLKQTSQYSDELDKLYSIWFDIFADSVDIHDRGSKENSYGPVLFVFDVSLINKANTGNIWVTKINPTEWKGVLRENRWFQSKKDFEVNFVYAEFCQMIVFRHCGGELPFKHYLKEIILDDPCLRDKSEDADYYSVAYGALRSALVDAGLDVPIRKRECNDNCNCFRNYKQKIRATHNKFFP